MMRRRLSLALVSGLLLALLIAGLSQAQEPLPTPTDVALTTEQQEDGASGSIRGTVYRDANNDGLCVGTGESGLGGVPIRFSNGSSQLYLQSGVDGTFGLVASGLGTWTVTAEPSADQGVVTSAASRTVELTEDNPLATGVDFCIGTARASSVVLPESGAPARPILWIALVAGVLLAGAGLFMLMRERRTKTS
jgi:hypothetical protein